MNNLINPSLGPFGIPPFLVQDVIPTQDQWQQAFATKADSYGFTFTADMLRSAGAPLTGNSGDDDSVVVQQFIDQSVATATAAGKVALIGFYLGSAKLWFANAVSSRSAHMLLNGDGIDVCVISSGPNAGGCWQHGTTQGPTTSFFAARGLTMQDSSSASGYVGLSCVWSGGTIPTIRLSEVKLLHFSQGMYLLNGPRDLNFYALTVYGPDFQVQTAPGIVVESTQNGPEVFTTTWIACNVFNYSYGWRFIGGGMIEGHRFFGSTCYNGWGMVQANVSGTGIVGLTGYQAVIWDFYCCDWQGWGYALDMRNCRGIRVRGGFWTFNDRTAASGTSTTPPWGVRTSQAANNMFDFSNCADVVLEEMQIDVSGSGTYGDCGIMHFDAGCTNVRVRNNAFYVNSTLADAIEFGDPSATVDAATPYNTMSEISNRWLNWVSGDKVADHACKQIDQSWIRDNYYGEQVDSGMFLIQQQTVVTMAASTLPNGTAIAKAHVLFPQRRYKNNLFNGGPPTVTIGSQQALALLPSPLQLGVVDQEGFDVIGSTNLNGVQITVPYIATGW